MKFNTKNSSRSTLHFAYKAKYIEEAMNAIFLSLQIDNHINWKNDTEQMIPKLSGACCAVRSMVHISYINTLINLLCILPFCYEPWNNF